MAQPLKRYPIEKKDLEAFRTEIKPLSFRTLSRREFLKARKFEGPKPQVPPPEEFFIEPPKKITHARRRYQPRPIRKLSTISLLLFFTLNPVASVYADENIDNSSTTPEVVDITETATTTEEILTLEEGSSETITENTSTSTEEEVVEENTATSTEVVIPPIVATSTATSTDNGGPQGENEDVSATTTEPVATTTPPSPEEPTPTPPPQPAPVNPPPSQPVPNPVPQPVTENEEPVATTTKEEVVAQIPVNISFNPTNRYTFADSECSLLQGGGYYCTHATATPEVVGASSAPSVFVNNTADGKEIFISDQNGTRQITKNNYDDDAPAYDPDSGLIVWHASIKDRFQIVSGSKDGENIRQLTGSPFNNTNPRIFGKSIVWQAWVNDNWEIMYIDDITAPQLSLRQLTQNSINDMFPEINGRYVTWGGQGSNGAQVFLYDRESGAISEVEKTESGTYENPRFVLVFDSRNDNGDVQTVGYDTASGKKIPLSSSPASSQPTNVPTPPTDEQGKAVPSPSGTSTLKVPKSLERDDEGDGGESA